MSLKAKVIEGFGWLAGANFIGQALTWVMTIVIMRLLSPADYGLLAMASIFVALLAMLAAAGLGPAIVQSIAIDEHKLKQLFGLITLLNAFLTLTLCVLAPAIAGFFDEPRLTDVVRILSLQFVISGFSVIPEALLARALKFKARAFIDLTSNVTGGVVTLSLAYAGYGVWSLVGGSTVTALGKSIGLNIVSPYLRWPSFSVSGLAPLLAYGGNVTASRVLWFFYSQADMFIAGKLLGKEILGLYSVAMHLASLPVQKLSSMLNQVAFPAFAQIQRDPDLVARHVLKAVRILGFFAFPVLWGISSVAPVLVHLVLGPKWELAILPLQILPLVMPFRMISNFLPAAVDAVGRPDVSVKNLITASVIMPLSFIVGGQYGITGLSLAWVIAFPIVFLANLHRSLPALSLRMTPFLSTIAWPATAGAAMYGAVAATGWALPASVHDTLRLAVMIGSGVITYGGLALLTNRAGSLEILQLVRSVVKQS
jgi:teichuronic acid exporter